MSQKIFFLVLLIFSLSKCQNIYPPVPSGSCCSNNQIEVSGQGTASAIADVAVISLSFRQKGLNSAQAVKALSGKVNKALAILKANGIEQQYIQTGSLYVNGDYIYRNGKSELVGQIASQSLVVKIRQLDPKGQKVGTLVDALAQIDGIRLDSVSFDIFDKQNLQVQARQSAFKQATQKAQDYAQAAGLTIGRVIKISDFERVQAPPRMIAYAMQSRAASVSSTTTVPVGTIEVNYRTTVTFELRL